MRQIVNLFSLRSIAAKLIAMAIAGAIFMILVAATVLSIARNELVAERSEKAHAIVDAVWQMADTLQASAVKGEITMDEAKKRFLSAAGLSGSKNHTNYVFIYDTETGLCVVNHRKSGAARQGCPRPQGRQGAAIRIDDA